VKAFAILFLLGTHLPVSSPNKILQAMQICVPIFLFMSGFGLQKLFEKKQGISYKDCFTRIFNLFKRYWLILAIFVPIVFYQTDKTFSWLEFLENITAMVSSYDPPTWFLSLYVELLLLFPLLAKINFKVKTYLILVLGLLVATRLILQLDIFDREGIIFIRHLKMAIIDLPIYMLGIAFAKYKIFEFFLAKMAAWRLDNIFIALFCIAIPVLGRAYLPMIGVTEIVLVPMAIIGIVNLCKLGGDKYLLPLSNHFINIWLCHCFLIRYCLYITDNRFFVYILWVFLSLACSVIINQIGKIKIGSQTIL
jgi:hypothetical protein